jgi:hypothetical protein
MGGVAIRSSWDKNKYSIAFITQDFKSKYIGVISVRINIYEYCKADKNAKTTRKHSPKIHRVDVWGTLLASK